MMSVMMVMSIWKRRIVMMFSDDCHSDVEAEVVDDVSDYGDDDMEEKNGDDVSDGYDDVV